MVNLLWMEELSLLLRSRLSGPTFIFDIITAVYPHQLIAGLTQQVTQSKDLLNELLHLITCTEKPYQLGGKRHCSVIWICAKIYKKNTEQRMNHLIKVHHFKVTACKGEACFSYLAYIL